LSRRAKVRVGFALRLALREGRYGLRRVGVYMASIALGVAALVSIHSFREDVARAVQEEADVLMGANARFSDDRPIAPAVAAIVDSLADAGIDIARVTTVSSMVLSPRTGAVRLLQVRALGPGYPFYGDVTTSPAGQWGAHLEHGTVLVDPAVLTQLGVAVGDSIVVGRARLRIAATADDLPTDLAYQTAIGPRVHVSEATLAEAELLGFGSLARYEVFLRLPDERQRLALRDRYGVLLRESSVSYRLAEEQARDLSNGVRFLGRFLSLVGLAALLLGGVGVASAIHVYIREKRPGIAVLRCIGAGQGTAFLAYLIQAALLGFLGAGAGVAVGLAVQRLMPVVLAGVLPVDVATRVSLASVLAGLGIGVWVAVVFALIPLLQVRDIPPLAALRQDFEPLARRFDVPRLGAYTLLAGSVLALCALEAPEPEIGLAFAAGLAVAGCGVGAVAWALMRLTRRFFPARASYPVRQGVSNLFRPQNQTLAITLALGLGAFVIGTIVQVEASIRDDLTVSFGSGRPNLLLFDVQTDQLDGIRAILPEAARVSAEVSPLVTSRIASINGVSPDSLRARTGDDRPEGWALRREYRNTYRPRLGNAEELVEGTWWDDLDGSTRAPSGGGRTARVSLETDVAESLRVGIGDTIAWDVSGVLVPSVVTSLRSVDWNRLEPNFFAILEPGFLEEAPQNILVVVRIGDAEARAAVQRDLVGAFPNVSALDFSRVQEAIESVLTRVRQAVAFLGAFCALAGVIVLVGALATSRVQRLREGALLRTLGARRRQVLTVLLTEYLALGSIATAGGLLLAIVAAALVVPGLFEMEYRMQPASLALVWASVVGLTVVVGLLGSRDLLRRPPLAVLREAPE
jgi:putative ABC transport system permease protein